MDSGRAGPVRGLGLRAKAARRRGNSPILVGGGRRCGLQTRGLVVDLGRDALQASLVLATVVGAEQEFTAVGQDHADVGLGAAAVATVGSRELAGGSKSCGHFASLHSFRSYTSVQHTTRPPAFPQPGHSWFALGVATYLCV